MLGFIIGFILGCFFGVFAMCLMILAKKGDEINEDKN